MECDLTVHVREEGPNAQEKGVGDAQSLSGRRLRLRGMSTRMCASQRH